ncbi:hypothetical protein ACIP93_32645 [Streptomyces sp. NPDC088745]|uniref:hypothetical protein n=1 Tax=Streptomyces sp. NPDC088745 TaxID=3365884 RepID=UPI0038298797
MNSNVSVNVTKTTPHSAEITREPGDEPGMHSHARRAYDSGRLKAGNPTKGKDHDS